jgi:TRAP-type C4-dicarboxylate transport system permease small subunit
MEPVTMTTAANILEKISALVARLTGLLVVCLCVGLVGSLLISVFFRYVVGQALSWPEEISLILFTWLVLLAGSLGVREEFHVKLVVFSSRLPHFYRRILEMIITAAIAAFGLILVYSGYDLVQRTAKHLTPTLRLPLDWVNYSAAVCGVLIFLHAAAVLARCGKSEENR